MERGRLGGAPTTGHAWGGVRRVVFPCCANHDGMACMTRGYFLWTPVQQASRNRIRGKFGADAVYEYIEEIIGVWGKKGDGSWGRGEFVFGKAFKTQNMRERHWQKMAEPCHASGSIYREALIARGKSFSPPDQLGTKLKRMISKLQHIPHERGPNAVNNKVRRRTCQNLSYYLPC